MCRDNVFECREMFTELQTALSGLKLLYVYTRTNKIIIINQFVCSTILLLQSMTYRTWDNALFTALTNHLLECQLTAWYVRMMYVRIYMYTFASAWWNV